MFDSGLFYTDLIFTDEAVRLIPLDADMQNYQSYLGWDFINQIHNLDQYQCIPTAGADMPTAALTLSLTVLYTIFKLLL